MTIFTSEAAVAEKNMVTAVSSSLHVGMTFLNPRAEALEHATTPSRKAAAIYYASGLGRMVSQSSAPSGHTVKILNTITKQNITAKKYRRNNMKTVFVSSVEKHVLLREV